MKRFLPLGSHGMPLHPSSCLAVKHHHLVIENLEQLFFYLESSHRVQVLIIPVLSTHLGFDTSVFCQILHSVDVVYFGRFYV